MIQFRKMLKKSTSFNNALIHDIMQSTVNWQFIYFFIAQPANNKGKLYLHNKTP